MSFIKKYKMQIIYTVITLLAGGLSALLSGSFDIYSTMKQPPLAPPAIVFPIMWTVLYILMVFPQVLLQTRTILTGLLD